MYRPDSTAFASDLEMKVVGLLKKKFGETATPLAVAVYSHEEGERTIAIIEQASIESEEAIAAGENVEVRLVQFVGTPNALELHATALITSFRPFGMKLARPDGSFSINYEDVLFVSVRIKGKPTSEKWRDKNMEHFWTALSAKVRRMGYCAFCVLPPLYENEHFQWLSASDSFQCDVIHSEAMVPRHVVWTQEFGFFDEQLVAFARLIRDIAPGALVAIKTHNGRKRLLLNMPDGAGARVTPKDFCRIPVETSHGLWQEEFDRHVREWETLIGNE